MDQRQSRVGWVDVRNPQGHLLFRYNPEKQLIEIKRRSNEEQITVDLKRYQQAATPRRSDP